MHHAWLRRVVHCSSSCKCLLKFLLSQITQCVGDIFKIWVHSNPEKAFIHKKNPAFSTTDFVHIRKASANWGQRRKKQITKMDLLILLWQVKNRLSLHSSWELMKLSKYLSYVQRKRVDRKDFRAICSNGIFEHVQGNQRRKEPSVTLKASRSQERKLAECPTRHSKGDI